MIAIHKNDGGFTDRWWQYCEAKDIPVKWVNCYSDNIIDDLVGCQGLMWRHSHQSPRDILIAKQILFALEHTGFRVFPDFRTAWHFDDKLGQKYLLERAGVPMVRSYAFFTKKEAMAWAAEASFPKVWKLRGGAGSANVQLVRTRAEAERKIRRAFGRGFPAYDAWGNMRERLRKFGMGKAGVKDLVKGAVRFVYPPEFARVSGRQRGYVYFQDFIPGNDSDTRIIVIDRKAFALKRYVREGDFRASGSGSFGHARDLFDERCLRIALDASEKLGAQSAAYDFVFDEAGEPLVVEISYGFSPYCYHDCPGYWDVSLRWHEGRFDPYGWMVEALMRD